MSSDSNPVSQSAGGLRILFAEDSRVAAAPVIAFLEKRGHQVCHVFNGRSAVERYGAEHFDLVLMDVVMPEMNGIEATRRIKALDGARWSPLIMMTVLRAEDELLSGLAAGADDYLIKPISLEILDARIGAMQRIALVQEGMFSLLGILDNLYEGIISINSAGIVRAFNKAAERIFDYAASEVIGQNVSMLMPAPYRAEHDTYLKRYLCGGKPQIIGTGRKVSGRRKGGEEFPMYLSVTELRRPNLVQDRLFIGLVRDVSQEDAAQQQIEFLARHDPLTRLPNRASLNERLTQVCAATGQSPGALLFIDLDCFKTINDNFGHEAGDLALVAVARRMRRILDEQDFVGRLGGDEFVILLQGITNHASVFLVAERLLQSIAKPIQLLGHQCQLGASIGIALIPTHGNTPSTILSAADSAMYAAKRAGKNRIVVWSKEHAAADLLSDVGYE